MRPHDDELTLEELDEQIEWRARSPRALPGSQSSPTTQLIQDLRRLYENEQGDEQSVEAVRQRLAERGALPASSRRRSRPAGSERSQPNAWQPPLRAQSQPRRRWSLAQRVTAIAAAAALVVLVGGLAAGLILVRQHNTGATPRATATPGQEAVASPTATTSTTLPPALAYIGSDGNIWTMSWPGGTPKQLTTDAQRQSSYYGLTWSPDGSLLAAAKGYVYNGDGLMVVLKPDGSVVAKASFQTYGNVIPFAWSPDSTMIAYRLPGNGDYLPDGTYDGTLVIVDAHTGKTIKTVSYVAGGSGCGGGGPMSDLVQELWTYHHLDFGRSGDIFAWSPDQRSMLVSEFCNGTGGPAAQVDLSSGAVSYAVPYDGGYQPGGDLIVGLWRDGTLGLTDRSGNHVRALAKAEPYANPPQYLTLLGFSVWSSDGKTIYYEHDDGIARIGVDGSNARQVLAGTALDSQDNATMLLVPSPSPDGHLLLYLQVTGSDLTPADCGTACATPQPTPTIPLTIRWYVAQADGTNPIPLPQGITEAAWQ